MHTLVIYRSMNTSTDLPKKTQERVSRMAMEGCCISFVGVSDLLLITGYVIRCGQDSVKLTTKLS